MVKKICVLYDANSWEKDPTLEDDHLELVDLLQRMHFDVLSVGVKALQDDKEHNDFKQMREFMTVLERGYSVLTYQCTNTLKRFVSSFGIKVLTVRDVVTSLTLKELLECDITVGEYLECSGLGSPEIKIDLKSIHTPEYPSEKKEI